MDKPLAIHDKKTTKPKHRQNPQKNKKKQQQEPTVSEVKVVYISNPVNFNTSASEFRSLVQQLTGKDSYYLDNGSTVGGRKHQESVVDSGHASMEVKDLEISVAGHEGEEIALSSSLNCRTTTSDLNSNLLDIGHQAVYDDDFYNMADQMLDNFWYD